MDSAENGQNKSSPLGPPLPRDSRGSLEVFNPSTYSSSSSARPASPVFGSQPSWQSCIERPKTSGNPELDLEHKFSSKSVRANADEITSWMALKEQNPSLPPAPQHQLSSPVSKSAIINRDHDGQKSPAGGEVGAAAQRAAEWGLVLQTDSETGKLQGVKVRTSGDDSNKPGNSRRDSGNSIRSSGDSDDGTGKIH